MVTDIVKRDLRKGCTLPPESCRCTPEDPLSSRACRVVDAAPMSTHCPLLHRHACSGFLVSEGTPPPQFRGASQLDSAKAKL